MTANRRGAGVGRAGPALAFALVALVALAGCGAPGPETGYGRVRSASVNGTGVLAGMVRAGGHEVRPALRLTGELRDWADVVVRFAPTPGPPPRDEAAWYDAWLDAAPGRRLVYVTRDYDAAAEYWSRALAGLPASAPARLRERVGEALGRAEGWAARLPDRAAKPAGAADGWFDVEGGPAPAVCKKLSGPWAEGVDPGKAAVTRRETIKLGAEEVLLTGDGRPLAVTWARPAPAGGSGGEGRVLAVAGGSFLLNLPLAEPARWPLARRAVDWVGGGGGPGPGARRVAFVEGSFVLGGRVAAPSVFSLLKVEPFGTVAAHLFALGLAACLSRAPRLGRPRAAARSDAERPSAHPEALGALLARTGRADAARAVLDDYRRWRGAEAAPPGRGPSRGSGPGAG